MSSPTHEQILRQMVTMPIEHGLFLTVDEQAALRAGADALAAQISVEDREEALNYASNHGAFVAMGLPGGDQLPPEARRREER